LPDEPEEKFLLLSGNVRSRQSKTATIAAVDEIAGTGAGTQAAPVPANRQSTPQHPEWKSRK
jgi:hypothetical protein